MNNEQIEQIANFKARASDFITVSIEDGKWSCDYDGGRTPKSWKGTHGYDQAGVFFLQSSGEGDNAAAWGFGGETISDAMRTAYETERDWMLENRKDLDIEDYAQTFIDIKKDEADAHYFALRRVAASPPCIRRFHRGDQRG